MKIYVINLKRDTTRRENSARQLNKQGVAFEFFNAVEADNGWTEYFDDYDEVRFLINTGRKVTRGEIGCYASHKSLWQKCIELDQPIMIMEDDFLLSENFCEAVDIVDQCIPDYGYIRLQSETRARKLKITEVQAFTLYRYTKIPHSAMCYALTPRVAQAFLEQSHSLCEPIDVMVKKAWVHQQPLYGLSPYTVTESALSSDSCIGHRLKDEKPLTIKARRLLTRIGWGFRLYVYNQRVKHSVVTSYSQPE